MKRNSLKGSNGFTLAGVAFLVFFFFMPLLANAGWYDLNWGYRKPITINGSTSAQTNYQVKVTVSFVSGKMNSDFSDIRFTSSDGTTLLDHWRESYTASTTADFWVEVPSIPTSGTTIYMYYGNPSASSASDASATFIFADDFDRANSATVGNGWTELETSSTAKIKDNALELKPTDDRKRPIVYKTFSALSGEFRWMFNFNWARTGSEGYYWIYMQLGDSASMDNNQGSESRYDDSPSSHTGTGVDLVWYKGASATHQVLSYYDSSSIQADVATISGSHTIEIIGNTSTGTYDINVDGGSAEKTGAGMNVTTTLNDMRFLAHATDQNNFSPRKFGYTFIAKYASPDPTASVGSEEAIFTNVTSSAGLSGINNTYGVAWGDYNNNGYPDLYVSGVDALYKNDGDGTFSAGPSLTGNDRSTHWGDYDNDGYLDFGATWNLYLSKNNGNNTFTLQTNSSIGITQINNLGDIGWIDYNNDGYLDLWAPNGSSPYAYMYRNDGDGTFTALAGSSIGLSASTNGETTIVADYDWDGYTDILYRASSVYLFKNNGDGTFTDTTATAGISLSGTSGGYNGTAFGDYDNDGDLDLYGGQGSVNKLYRNNGDGTFTDVTSSAGVAGSSLKTKGVAWGDYDNDGDLDLYVAQESGANQLFRNNGDGTFTDVAPNYGLNDSSSSYGVMWADYDLDGDLDLFVGNSSSASKLFQNDINSDSYLKVKVSGNGSGGSPKDGTGARVELYNAAGTTLLAVREIFGGEGYGSHSPRIVHFGLASGWGGGSGTYTVKVRFTSGDIETQSGVVPTSESITIGGTTLNNTIEIQEESVNPVTATVTTPSNGSYYNASSMPSTFQGAVADNSGGSGLEANSAQFYLKRASDNHYWNGSDWNSTSVQWLATTHSATTGGTEVTWTSNVTMPTWSDGTYYAQAKATDRAGNSYQGTEISFYYDTSSGVTPLNNFLVEASSGGAIGDQSAGTAFSIKITARDASNNTVTTFTGTVDITSTGTLSAGSGTTANFTAGVLSSHSVTISNTGTFTITATRTGGTESGTSNSFAVNAGSASKLAFTQQPGGGTAGAAWSTQPKVAVQDAYGNTVTSDSSTQVTLAIGTNPGSGTLSGTATVTVSSGVASFSGLSIDKAGTGYTLQATSSPSYTAATSNAFNITVGSASKLAFTQQPGGGTAGAAWSTQPKVAVQDAYGNTVTSDNTTQVTLAIGTNPGSGTLSGTTTVTVSSGVATFSGLSIDKAGTGYTLQATSSPSYTAATSNAFNITVGSASKLAFTQQPGGGTAGAAWSTQPKVAVQDAYGNTVTSDSSTQVTLAIGTNPGSGTLSGTATVTVSSGVATFSGLSIDKAGTGYTLQATSSPSYTAATSDAFNITVGSASKLAFTQQPTNETAGATISPAVTVKIMDNYDNVVTSASNSVTVAIGTNAGGGTLSGTKTVSAVSGVAEFNDLSIDKTGIGYTLTASSAGLTGDTSGSFNITAATAFYLKVTGTATMTAGTTNELTIKAYDQYDNVATAYTGSKSLTFSGPNNGPDGSVPTVEGAAIGAATTVSFTSGVSDTGGATLIAYKAETATVDVTDGSIDSAGEASYDLDLTVNAAPAASLTQVSGNNQSGVVGATLSNFFVVKVMDDYQNPVSGTTVNWSITGTPSGATGQSLSAAATSTDAEGKAESQLTLGNKAGTYTIEASAASLSGSPLAFTATANSDQAANISLVSGGCQTGSLNTALTNPFVVKVTDQNGNGVSDVTVSWSIEKAPYGATGHQLSSSSVVTDSNGKASSTLTIGDKAGFYKVEASCSGLSGSPLIFCATTGNSFFLKGGSYHKVSVPYNLTNGNAEAVFDELGAYDPVQWRLFRYDGSVYDEYPSTPDLSPGLAYWIIVAQDKVISVEGSVPGTEVTLTLQPGWNQIGGTFNCSVSWDDIKSRNSALFDNGTIADVLWGYDPELGEYFLSSSLDPWQGYWVYNSSGSAVNLVIPVP